MADGSTKVVYAALAGNVLVAGSKYAAGALSGSSAMLTEAVHSTADCINQLLLLIGVHRQKLKSDRSHPFGYGMEMYFWTFVVAVLVLLGGGAYSLYQGYTHLLHPELIRTPVLNLVVLGLSAIFEAASFAVGYRQYRKVATRHRIPGQKVGLFQFIKWSKDPSLYESLLEDGAALAGIVIAIIGTVGNAYLGAVRADGAASVAIGLMLIANGTAILMATRSLIAGEAVAPPVLRDMWKSLEGAPWHEKVAKLRTLHLGPSCILVAVNLRRTPQVESEFDLQREIDGRLRAVDDRVTEILFRYSGEEV
jgi:cation diffusion facilitator family transporter